MKKWKTVIEPNTSLFDFKLRELWSYRDLCLMFIRKNYITRYKQTIFGPLYMILSPLLTSGLFSVVFGTVVGVSTDGVPDFLFYMLGNLAWTFFSNCVLDNRNTFEGNAYIMGKVYFPRLVIPIANTMTKIINLMVQYVLFIVFLVIYRCRGFVIEPNAWVVITPFLLVMLGVMGLGIGLIASSLTIKYRDLNVVLGFAMNLFMYITPVIYPLSNLTGNWRTLALLNPVAPVIEATRYAFFGTGIFSVPALLWSVAFTLLVAFAGLLLFNKVEKNFIDTI